jgi:hypothetical protein
MRVVSIQDHDVKSSVVICMSFTPDHDKRASKGGECGKSVMLLYRNVARRNQKALQQYCSAREGWQSGLRYLNAMPSFRKTRL